MINLRRRTQAQEKVLDLQGLPQAVAVASLKKFLEESARKNNHNALRIKTGQTTNNNNNNSRRVTTTAVEDPLQCSEAIVLRTAVEDVLRTWKMEYQRESTGSFRVKPGTGGAPLEEAPQPQQEPDRLLVAMNIMRATRGARDTNRPGTLSRSEGFRNRSIVQPNRRSVTPNSLPSPRQSQRQRQHRRSFTAPSPTATTSSVRPAPPPTRRHMHSRSERMPNTIDEREGSMDDEELQKALRASLAVAPTPRKSSDGDFERAVEASLQEESQHSHAAAAEEEEQQMMKQALESSLEWSRHQQEAEEAELGELMKAALQESEREAQHQQRLQAVHLEAQEKLALELSLSHMRQEEEELAELLQATMRASVADGSSMGTLTSTTTTEEEEDDLLEQALANSVLEFANQKGLTEKEVGKTLCRALSTKDLGPSLCRAFSRRGSLTNGNKPPPPPPQRWPTMQQQQS